MGRRELREQIFLLLFRVEFNNPEEMPAQLKMFFETGSYDEDMHSFSEKDREYITEKYNHIMESLPDIDKQLSEKAENWDITRMGKVELTVLRLAVYEIEKDDSVPASVAINGEVCIKEDFYGRTKCIFGSTGKCVYKKYVHSGFYAAEALRQRRSKQLQIPSVWTYLFYVKG